MKHTKEEKQSYFKNLREKWKLSKDKADVGAINEVIEEYGLKVSPYSFAFVAAQMKELGLVGIPYVDMKTYDGWRENGFQVRRGTKAKVAGLLWLRTDKEDKENNFSFPKVYHLFHKTQVEEIKC